MGMTRGVVGQGNIPFCFTGLSGRRSRMARSKQSTKALREIQRASLLGLTLTPKPSEILGIPKSGALAVWHENQWWTAGSMKAAHVCLDLNGIMGMFTLEDSVWKVRVLTASEATNIFND